MRRRKGEGSEQGGKKECEERRRRRGRGKRMMKGITRERQGEWIILRIAERLLASSLNSIKVKLSAL